MRPIRLKLAGMHSYRETQEIDFETLCQAGLFGIFGPTGSGKSTILDAITLALYGQVVRLGGGNHPREVLNQHEQRVFVSFTFELGKGEDRRQYTVEREFGLDKKGNKRQPEVRLIQLGHLTGEADVVLESKATAATAAIESLIGLTLQDFTRAVVLPQGQFSRFLTLKGSERNEMLQRMFRLHIYGEKLSERVRHALEQARDEMHRLQLEVAALGEAGSEALDSARKIWEEAAQKEQQYAAQRQEWAEKIRQMEQLHKWQEELEQVRTSLQSHLSRQGEIDAWKHKILAWKSSMQLWPMIQRWERLHEEWLATEQAMAKSRELQERSQLAWEDAEAAYQQAQGKLAAEEPELIQQKGRLVQAAEWEAELGAIREEWNRLEQDWDQTQKALAETSEKLAQDEEALRQWEQEQKQLDEQIRQAAVTPEWRDQVAAAREAKQQWNRELALQQELEAARAQSEAQMQQEAGQVKQFAAAWQASAQKLEQAKAGWDALEARPVMTDREWEEASSRLSEMKQLGRQWREQEKQLALWQEKWEKLEQERQQAQAGLAALQTAVESQDDVVLKLKAEREERFQAVEQWQQRNMARFLRERLEEGQECPVCGSTHHVHNPESHLTEQESSDEGEKLRQRLKTAEEALREAERLAHDKKEVLVIARTGQAALEHKAAELRDEQTIIANQIELIRQECAKQGEPWRVESIDQLLSVYQREEKELATRQELREQVKAERERLQRQLELLREEEAEQRRLHERSELLWEQWRSKHEDVKARLEAAAAQVQKCAEVLEQKRGPLAVEEIEQRYEEIGRRDRQVAELQRIRAEKEALRAKLLNACDTGKARQSELQVRTQALRERLEEKKQSWEQKHSQWTERTGGIPAAERIRQTEAKLAELRQSVTEAEAKRKACADSRERLQTERVKHAEAYAQLTRQRAEALEALQQAMQQTGIESVEQARELYAGRDQLEPAEEQVAQFEQSVGQLRYDEQRLLQAIDGRSVSRDEFFAAKQVWEECEQTFQEAQKQVAVAKEQVERVEKNHDKWLQLQGRIREQQDELSRLEDLRKLFEAKAFVQFIAEEKLVSIARDASYHLKRMTGNRYGLEIGDEGEFVLRDEAAGGMRRPVSTLSGGETFLTSLSLALALSMEIQMRGGRLEFFFLDEGFGTLDPELLEVVMDALERLRMDDFTIGVISHVPEVRYRMPRRLIVTPADPMGAGSKIHLELE